MSLRTKVEAILFLSDKPLGAGAIAIQAGADINEVRAALTQLMQEYESRETGIRINAEDGYLMQVKEEFENLSQQLLPLEVRTGCLRTLSAIALQEPVYQKEIIEMRGGGAYEHIKELIEMGLVKRRREGFTNVLSTTKLFGEYFDLSDNGTELQHTLKERISSAS